MNCEKWFLVFSICFGCHSINIYINTSVCHIPFAFTLQYRCYCLLLLFFFNSLDQYPSILEFEWKSLSLLERDFQAIYLFSHFIRILIFLSFLRFWRVEATSSIQTVWVHVLTTFSFFLLSLILIMGMSCTPFFPIQSNGYIHTRK